MKSVPTQKLHVGRAAGALSVTVRYLKLLEAAGMIPAAERDERGFRVYSVEDLNLLKEQGVGSRPRRLKSLGEVAGVNS